MLGRVLVVENTIPYAEKTCDVLKKRGVEAAFVPSPSIVKGAKRGSLYRKAVFDIVRSTLEKGGFDVVVINLNLEDEGIPQSIEDLYKPGDYYGVEILRHVTENYPGISCIVCTADPPELITAFSEKYNLAEIVRKKTIPMRTDVLCGAVERVLTEGHLVRRKIGESWYELKGVNSQLYRFLHNRDVIPRVFSGIKDYDNRLIKALGADLRDKRVGEATLLMADLWHLEPGLPCYPLINELGEMEHGRAFWEGHRDHLIHQLLVYLLGLYLYYGSDQLKEALTVEMSEEKFLRIWKIAALFHDLGYVFEAEYKGQEGNISDIYNQVFRELNDLRRRCLHYYFSARGVPFLVAEDSKIRDHAEIYIKEVDAGQILELSGFGSEDLFSYLEPRVQKVDLGNLENSLQRYWKYAMSNPTRDGSRSGYVDHGIAGALVLLQQYRSLRYYVEKALPFLQKSEIPVSQKITDLIVSLAPKITACKPAVELAAFAIALHNVNVDIWDHDHAFRSESLTLHQYRLSLKKSPLAFFLALVDSLQSWDRPRYAMPRGADYAMQAQDVEIRLEDDKIRVAYKTDIYRGTPRSVFARVRKMMSHYMHSEDLESLLEEGG